MLASTSTATDMKSTSVFFYEEKDLVQYQPEDWRLFIDRSKRSLKSVLLHNGNRFASVPLAHSTTLKEKYEAVKYVLDNGMISMSGIFVLT